MNDLDRIDYAILAALQGNGRIAMSKLAERVNLSETPCARRLRRLENEGYIEGYRAILSRKALGLGVTAFAQIRFGTHDPKLSDAFERAVRTLPHVVSCYNITGSADYLLQVTARDLDEYGTLVRDVLRALPGVTSVESMLSLQEIKRDEGLPLSMPAG